MINGYYVINSIYVYDQSEFYKKLHLYKADWDESEGYQYCSNSKHKSQPKIVNQTGETKSQFWQKIFGAKSTI